MTYRGPVGNRGINISRETYGQTWTLRLVDGMWTLIDHNGDALHSFIQKELHHHVALPGFMPGYPGLYLLGLGPRIYCFEPEAEVIDAIRPYIQQSEQANAPQLPHWHRRCGRLFLALGALNLAGVAAVLVWASWSDGVSGFLWLNVAALAIPFGVLGGGSVVTGVQYLRKAARFAGMVGAMGD